ncbi:hypothetical protein [Vampirovibrio chlorellavorus]|uniref:hypothetical protein n=1 Tax=Vampirovibrio chlorellavorus TaxID=758823 RepID=UPI0026EFA727|nr:hypothetical protein [Vampirovibrio chlorellavorus]
MSISAHDREQNARVLNTNVIPAALMSEKSTKNRIAGVLLAAAVCLAAGGFMLPALFLPAACCGIVAGTLFLYKAGHSPPKE